MRVKEQLQKTKAKEEALDWSFAEWLDHFRSEPTSKELDAIEKELNIKQLYKLQSSNNPYYRPLQGAQMNAGAIIGLLIAVGTVIKDNLPADDE